MRKKTRMKMEAKSITKRRTDSIKSSGLRTIKYRLLWSSELPLSSLSIQVSFYFLERCLIANSFVESDNGIWKSILCTARYRIKRCF